MMTNKNYFLSLDTSNGFCSVCLSKNDIIIDYIIDDTLSRQSKNLLLFINQLFNKHNINFDNISNIIITIGPGSFTGIRVALAAARGIKLVKDISLLGLSNFQVIAHNALLNHKLNGNITVLLNARREQLYLQRFNHNLEEIDNPKIININEVSEISDYIVCDKDTSKLFSQKNDLIKETDFFKLDARNISSAIHHYMKIKTTKLIKPLYIRLPDAKPQI